MIILRELLKSNYIEKENFFKHLIVLGNMHRNTCDSVEFIQVFLSADILYIIYYWAFTIQQGQTNETKCFHAFFSTTMQIKNASQYSTQTAVKSSKDINQPSNTAGPHNKLGRKTKESYKRYFPPSPSSKYGAAVATLSPCRIATDLKNLC